MAQGDDLTRDIKSNRSPLSNQAKSLDLSGGSALQSSFRLRWRPTKLSLVHQHGHSVCVKHVHLFKAERNQGTRVRLGPASLAFLSPRYYLDAEIAPKPPHIVSGCMEELDDGSVRKYTAHKLGNVAM